MDKIRCIIIDDEEFAIDVIDSFCQRLPYVEVIAKFTNPLEAAAFIGLQKDSIDLVFLDIEMPRFSGIDFLKAYTLPNVILATAYADYALPSYEYGVVDYLLKPFSFDRFSQAVQKVYDKVQKQRAAETPAALDSETMDSFYLKTERNSYVKINCSDILFIEGAQNYSVIKTKAEDIVSPLRLKALENQLPKKQFVRIHKSYIINLAHFESIKNNMIKLVAVEQNLTVTPGYKENLIAILDKQLLK